MQRKDGGILQKFGKGRAAGRNLCLTGQEYEDIALIASPGFSYSRHDGRHTSVLPDILAVDNFNIMESTAGFYQLCTKSTA